MSGFGCGHGAVGGAGYGPGYGCRPNAVAGAGYGHGYRHGVGGFGHSNFALIVVLFILLIIVGAAFYC